MKNVRCVLRVSRIVMIGNDTGEIIQGLFDSFLHRYQIGLEQFMRGTNFIFYYVSGMHYACNKISLWIIHTFS